MTWTPPTVNDFKIRFPVFETTDEELVQAILDEAVGEVGSTWIERDRTPGVLHLAAHLLSTQGSGVQSPGGGVAVTGAIKRRKVGDVETEFHGIGQAGPGLLGTYQTTAYGRRYLELLRRNFPAIAVV